MRRIDLMISNGTLWECKPMTWRRRRAFSRACDYRLRYVCPPDATIEAFCDLLIAVLGIGVIAAVPVAFVVLFVRWWLCM